MDRYYEIDVEYPRLRIFRLRDGAADSLRMAVSDCAGGGHLVPLSPGRIRPR